MSYSFYLNNVQDLAVHQVIQKAGLKDLHFVEGSGQPKEGKWPEDYAYVYIDDVTARALETEIDGDTMKIRIFAASSPDDYKLAIKLTRAIAELCGSQITPEDNDTLELKAFTEIYDVDWIKEHCKRSLSFILGCYKLKLEEGGEITGVRATLKLGPNVMADMEHDDSGLAQAFFKRLKRLNYIHKEDIYQASIIVLQDEKSGKKVRLSTYSEGVPTLLFDKNTVITLCSDASLKDDGNENSMIYVSMGQLKTLLGSDATWLSEGVLLLPKLEGEAWQQFEQQAREITIDNLFDYGYLPDEDPFKDEHSTAAANDGLTQEEIQTLTYAPVIVFIIVSSADGKIDQREVKAFVAELLRGIATESPLLTKILMFAAASFEAHFTEISQKDVDIRVKLAEIIDLLSRRVDATESLRFRQSLYAMGKKIAEASGGLLGIFGNKVSGKERKALAGLAQLLEVDC